MIEADRVLSTPPLNSSSIQTANPPSEVCAESVDSFSSQPAIGQPESQTLTGESPKPFEAMDLAMLRFVRCLVGYGATVDVASAVMAAELERLKGKTRRRLTLVGDRLVPVSV